MTGLIIKQDGKVCKQKEVQLQEKTSAKIITNM